MSTATGHNWAAPSLVAELAGLDRDNMAPLQAVTALVGLRACCCAE